MQLKIVGQDGHGVWIETGLLPAPVKISWRDFHDDFYLLNHQYCSPRPNSPTNQKIGFIAAGIMKDYHILAPLLPLNIPFFVGLRGPEHALALAEKYCEKFGQKADLQEFFSYFTCLLELVGTLTGGFTWGK